METRTVLIVDANADTAELMAYILSRRYTVQIAPSRTLAMRALFSFSPDVIVAEYFMAGIPFSDFVNALRQFNPASNIVLTSAIVGLDDVAAAYPLHYLAKPFHPNRLLTTVARAMISNPNPQTLELAL